MQISRWFAAVGALMFAHQGALAAAPKPDCYGIFIKADEDRNGVVDAREDRDGYRAALTARGIKTVSAAAIARDEFISACEAGAFEAAMVLGTVSQAMERAAHLPKLSTVRSRRISARATSRLRHAPCRRRKLARASERMGLRRSMTSRSIKRACGAGRRS